MSVLATQFQCRPFSVFLYMFCIDHNAANMRILLNCRNVIQGTESDFTVLCQKSSSSKNLMKLSTAN